VVSAPKKKKQVEKIVICRRDKKKRIKVDEDEPAFSPAAATSV